jgi:hypothetical protein
MIAGLATHKIEIYIYIKLKTLPRPQQLIHTSQWTCLSFSPSLQFCHKLTQPFVWNKFQFKVCYLILEICGLFMLLASPLYHFPHGWEVLTSVVHFFLLKRTSSLGFETISFSKKVFQFLNPLISVLKFKNFWTHFNNWV